MKPSIKIDKDEKFYTLPDYVSCSDQEPSLVFQIYEDNVIDFLKYLFRHQVKSWKIEIY